MAHVYVYVKRRLDAKLNVDISYASNAMKRLKLSNMNDYVPCADQILMMMVRNKHFAFDTIFFSRKKSKKNICSIKHHLRFHIMSLTISEWDPNANRISSPKEGGTMVWVPVKSDQTETWIQIQLDEMCAPFGTQQWNNTFYVNLQIKDDEVLTKLQEFENNITTAELWRIPNRGLEKNFHVRKSNSCLQVQSRPLTNICQ